LGYKKIPYQVTNLTPGLHLLQVKPKTGLTTLPVLFPQIPEHPEALGDSTEILHYLEKYTDGFPLLPESPAARQQAWLLEDWLDESIGIASRFVYYHFRAHAGKALDPSLPSQLVINLVRYRAGITEARVAQAEKRLSNALEILSPWQEKNYLVNQTISVADITAAALLSPLGLIPHYRDSYPWLFEQIASIHEICGEKVPFT
jgi:glutathione S-transferase